jgi:hypothetical protein
MGIGIDRTFLAGHDGGRPGALPRLEIVRGHESVAEEGP